jgi:hypothetical protein
MHRVPKFSEQIGHISIRLRRPAETCGGSSVREPFQMSSNQMNHPVGDTLSDQTIDEKRTCIILPLRRVQFLQETINTNISVC